MPSKLLQRHLSGLKQVTITVRDMHFHQCRSLAIHLEMSIPKANGRNITNVMDTDFSLLDGKLAIFPRTTLMDAAATWGLLAPEDTIT